MGEISNSQASKTDNIDILEAIFQEVTRQTFVQRVTFWTKVQ
jgi:hypothetical protein